MSTSDGLVGRATRLVKRRRRGECVCHTHRHGELESLVLPEHGELERVAARAAVHKVREGDAHEVVRARQLDRAVIADRHAVELEQDVAHVQHAVNIRLGRHTREHHS